MDHLRDIEKWPIESGKSGYFMRVPSFAETIVTPPQEVAGLVMAYNALRKLGSSSLAGKILDELMRICRESNDLGNSGWQNLGGTLHDMAEAGEVAVVPNREVHGQMTLAMLQRQPVLMSYRRLESEESYPVKIFPHKWIRRDYCWYLVAEDLDGGGQRCYALPRIMWMNAAPTPKGFVEPVFDDRYEHAFGIWLSSDKDAPMHEICVEVTGYWARIVRERQWHPSQRLEELAPDRARIHFQLNELVEVKSWVLKLGGAATVIAPQELRDLVLEELEQMNRNYES